MKIPQYTNDKTPIVSSGQTHSLGGERVSPINIPKTEEAEWAAIKQNANQLTNIGQRMIEADETYEFNEAVLKLSDGYAKIKNDIATNKEWAEDKRPVEERTGVTDWSNLSIDEHEAKRDELARKLKEDVLAGVKRPRAKRAADMEARKMGLSNRVAVQGIAYSRFVDKGRVGMNKALDVYMNQHIAGDTSALNRATTAIKSAVSSGFYTQNEGRAIEDKFINDATAGYYERLINDDPKGMYRELVENKAKPDAWKPLDEEYKTALLSKLNVKYSQAINEEKTYTLGLWEGESDNKPIETLKEFKKAGRDYTGLKLLDEREYARLGRYLQQNADQHNAAMTSGSISPVVSGRVNRMVDEARAAIRTNGKIPVGVENVIQESYSLNKKTREKGQAIIEQYHYDVNQDLAEYEIEKNIVKVPLSQLDSYKNSVDYKTAGESFVNAEKKEALINSAVAKKKAAIAKDPVSYMISNFGSELKDVAPEKRNQWLIDKQIEQEIPKHAIGLLTNPIAESIVKDLELVDGEQKVKALQKLQNSYPKSEYGIVYRDLVKAKLPIGTQFLVSQDDPSQTLVRQKYGKVFDMKEAELKANLGSRAKDVENEFDVAFEEAFADYSESVSNQDGGEYDNTILKGVRDIIKKAVMYDARVDGADVDTITKHYVDKSFNDMYSYQNGHRIPKKFNANNVEGYTKFVMETLKESPLIVPPSANGELRGEFLRNEYIDHLQKHGKWVNIGDGSGLRLVDGNGQLVLVGKEGDDTARLMEIKFGTADGVGGVIRTKKADEFYRRHPVIRDVWRDGTKVFAGNMLKAWGEAGAGLIKVAGKLEYGISKTFPSKMTRTKGIADIVQSATEATINNLLEPASTEPMTQ